MPFRTRYRGRRVLVTGHTGFVGAWLSTWLLELGAEVVGLSLPAPSDSLWARLELADAMPSHLGDVRDPAFVQAVFIQERPELVFHLAARTSLDQAQTDPVGTFATNVQGTAHVLEACRHTPGVEAILCATSETCYENRGWDWGYRENDPLGGDEPIAAAAAATEHVARSFQRSFFDHAEVPIGLATVRTGNLLGGGDTSADRLLPEAITALSRGIPVRLRRPTLTRSWQHVVEALAGYLTLMPRLADQPQAYSGPWNLGPLPENTASVRDLMDLTIGLWGGGQIRTDLSTEGDPPQAGYLKLAIERALTRLPWRPHWNLETTVRQTLAWYRAAAEGAGAEPLRQLCREQIAAWESPMVPHTAGDPVILATLSPRRASA